MYPYWLLLGFFAFGAMTGGGRKGPSDRRFNIGLVLGFIGILIMIGLRDRVGVDWYTYVKMMRFAGRRELAEIAGLADPGYQFVNWSAQQLGAGIWLVNLVCAALFTWGFARFVTNQPFPWLAALIAIPYLVIVVAMNYTRQSAAIGFVLAGITGLTRGGSFMRFGLYVAGGALFHASAVIALPLALVGQHRSRIAQLTLLPAVMYLVYNGFLSERVQQYVSTYLDKSLEAQGAAIRVGMCVFPAIIFLLLRSRLRFEAEEATLWRNYSLAALALGLLLFVLPSTAAVDRVALYILPLQIAVLARLPFVLNSELLARALILFGSAAVLFVWLNFAFNAHAWIPYRISW